MRELRFRKIDRSKPASEPEARELKFKPKRQLRFNKALMDDVRKLAVPTPDELERGLPPSVLVKNLYKIHKKAERNIKLIDALCSGELPGELGKISFAKKQAYLRLRVDFQNVFNVTPEEPKDAPKDAPKN